MNKNTHIKNHTGFAIAIAWPQTYCKQPGSWYDGITTILGVNKNNYYKVGHAALVLVNIENETCHYFDFGRYHTPFQYGRVRSELTDSELHINTKPIFANNSTTISNYLEILTELQNNSACHGEGEILASYTQINYNSAFNKASEIQKDSPLPYGPFKYRGSNCSRFVNTVILESIINLKQKFKLKYLNTLTPTPLNNVNSLKYKQLIPKLLITQPFLPIEKLSNKHLKSTLSQPVKANNIPTDAQWLSGEGAGSWFVFSFEGSFLNVTRYSSVGDIECSDVFKNSLGEIIMGSSNLKITYPSNCQVVTFLHNSKIVSFDRVNTEDSKCIYEKAVGFD